MFALVEKAKKEKRQISRAQNSSLLISFRDKPFLLFRMPSLSCFFPSFPLQNQVSQPHLHQSQLEKQKRQKDGFKLNRETKRKMI